MSSAKKKFIRRKRYFIKKAYQTKFFIGFILLLVLQALLTGALFMYISSQTLTTGYSDSRFVIAKTSNFFFTNFVIMSAVVGIVIGLTGIFIFIFLSHRIAGPLYRFEKALQDISEGNLAHRINVRKTDQLTELQSALNLALNKMDDRLKEIKKDLDGLHSLTSSHDKEKNMQEIKEAASQIKQKLAFFKTS